jgi:protein arginine N-methyltransferase 1
MRKLSKETALRRAAHLRVEIGADNRTVIFRGGRSVDGGPHGLAILDAFARAVPFAEALAKLQARTPGARDWLDLTAAIERLYQSGILLETSEQEPAIEAGPNGFGGVAIHVAMLNDRRRTAAFLAGIREVVRPGDVVLEIGTGTGVLAVAAARCGARHVYAIEATRMGEVARAVFAANGLTDRITLVSGWSTQVSLPERAEVLIAEIIGNEPLAEEVLEVTMDARRRLLKPEARLVPARVRVFGLPVSIPRAELHRRTFTPETLRKWQAWYGIDFSPLAGAVEDSPQAFYIRPSWARKWRPVSDPVLLADCDLAAMESGRIEKAAVAVANVAGCLDGVLVYFELQISEGCRVSTHPAEAGIRSNWRCAVWLPGRPVPLKPGERFTLTYRRNVPGAPGGVTVSVP